MSRRKPVLDRRRAGVLLHPASLPSGTLGDDALKFLDILHAGGFSVWQMLPLGPTGADGSPYSPWSAYAGNPAMIDPADPPGRPRKREYAAFREREAHWLEDYALFGALRRAQDGKPWWEWPRKLRDRQKKALAGAQADLREPIEALRREQYRFFRQWAKLRARASELGILLCGDLPMFVVLDSADVWTAREYFRLDAGGRPVAVAGVPPDAFAADGQLWGNPLYDWEAMARDGYDWWRRRLRHELARFDLVRFDHFRGLAACWEIPADAKTAREGTWAPVPGRELLAALTAGLGPLPLIAENLGTITPDVEKLRREFGLPGMHVLQFAFDGSKRSPHAPARHERQGAVYTGTHDNDTTRGWYASLDDETRERVHTYFGDQAAEMPGPLLRAALASRARLAVLPMQDLLGLGPEHRMNRPGTVGGNWTWRFDWAQVGAGLAAHCRGLVLDARR